MTYHFGENPTYEDINGSETDYHSQESQKLLDQSKFAKILSTTIRSFNYFSQIHYSETNPDSDHDINTEEIMPRPDKVIPENSSEKREKNAENPTVIKKVQVTGSLFIEKNHKNSNIKRNKSKTKSPSLSEHVYKSFLSMKGNIFRHISHVIEHVGSKFSKYVKNHYSESYDYVKKSFTRKSANKASSDYKYSLKTFRSIAESKER